LCPWGIWEGGRVRLALLPRPGDKMPPIFGLAHPSPVEREAGSITWFRVAATSFFAQGKRTATVLFHLSLPEGAKIRGSIPTLPYSPALTKREQPLSDRSFSADPSLEGVATFA